MPGVKPNTHLGISNMQNKLNKTQIKILFKIQKIIVKGSDHPSMTTL